MDKDVRVLEDKGCKTKLLPTSFVDRKSDLLDIRDNEIDISHSNSRSEEESRKMVIDAAVQIGGHFYRSTWAVVNMRYDVVLCMPWNITVSQLSITRSLQSKCKDSNSLLW